MSYISQIPAINHISTETMLPLLDLLISAITVDMEKSKEWFKTMWEKIFGEKKS